MRTFGASNTPHTCLWCGEKLKPGSTEKSLKKTLALCKRLYSGVYAEYQQSEALSSHELMKNVYGYRGSGCFCTLDCGFQFALAAAYNGYRISGEVSTTKDFLSRNEEKQS
jgi:hypothetical protein